MSGPATIILTGESGAGKTLTASHLLESRPHGFSGLLSLSASEKGARRAIVARLLPEGDEVALAHLTRRAPHPGKPPSFENALDDAGRAVVRLGPWDFSPRAIESVNRHLCRLAEEGRAAPPPRRIIIDEIGPLELVHGAGFLPGLRAVAEAALPSVIVVRPSLVESIRAFLAAVRGTDSAARVAVVEISRPADSPRTRDAVLAMLDDPDAGAV